MRIAAILTLAALAIPVAAVSAGVPDFDEIVVVAAKRETGIRDVAADVTVLDSAELQSVLSTSLADAFRFVPGVTHEASGSRFGTEGISIRGIGGNRIALEVDGVPLSKHFSIGGFSNATRDFADTGLLGQIEVLRGPASALYGSSALGGVVSMRTLDPRRFASDSSPGGSATALYRGADESRNLRGVLGLGSAGASLLFGGSYRDGSERESAALDDPMDRQSYERSAAIVKLVGENRFEHNWQFSVVRQARATRTEITSVLGGGRFSSTTRLEGDDTHEMDMLSVEYHFGTGWISDGLLRAYHAAAEIEQHTLDERGAARSPVSIERDFYYEQRIRGAELNLWRDLEHGQWSHRLGAGLEHTEHRTEELRDGTATSLMDGSTSSDILGESFPVRDFPITETRELGAFVSDRMSAGSVTLIAALRYNRNGLTPDSDTIYEDDNPATGVVSLSDSDLSPKLGAIWRIGDDLDICLQYAEGFRSPPFEDANIGLDIPLFNIRAIPNPELQPETSQGWEAGMRWQGKRSRLQLSAFHTSYDDFIETKVRIGVDPVSGRLLFQSINIGDAYIRGVEARFVHELSGRLQGLALHAAAYWAEGKNRDNSKPLNSVGPAEAVLGATWRSTDERTELRTLVTATDDWSQRDESGGDLFKPPGHAVIDVFLAHRISERMTIRAGIGNLTDRTCWRWSEIRGLAPDDALLPTLAEAGRNYSIGLQWDW